MLWMPSQILSSHSLFKNTTSFLQTTYITKHKKVAQNWHFWHCPTNINCNPWLDIKTSVLGVFINWFQMSLQIWHKNSLAKFTLYDFDEFPEVRITSCWGKVHIGFYRLGQPHFNLDISQILFWLLKRFTSWSWQILRNQDFHRRPCRLHWSTSSPPPRLTHHLKIVFHASLRNVLCVMCDDDDSG